MIQETRAAAQMNEFDRAALKPGATNGLALAAEGVGDIPGSYTEQPHGDK